MSKLKDVTEKYNPSKIEQKWQAVWEKEKIYSPDLNKTTKPFYNLWMFPYPSGEGLHAGHAFASTGSDVYGRFMRMNGKNIFQPIGYDSFGIHSENFAMKIGDHPKEMIARTTKNYEKQLKSLGHGYDWTRTVTTSNADYYKWTQWLFIQLFKAGLAYRKKAPVNFCPSCKTVLSDEQAESGLCERCGSTVEKKDLEQWFFKITKYADRLLDGLSQIDWSEKVKIAQKQWIGKSEGAQVEFKINNSKSKIEVFTTRPDTFFGATFLVLSPEHPLVSSIDSKDVKDYLKSIKGKSDQNRIAKGKGKTGVFSELYAINPVNNDKIPIWIADYVLMSYGTGAIMAVPAHDQRDFEFANKYNLPIREVIKPLKDTYRGYLKRKWSKDFDEFVLRLMKLNPKFLEKTDDSIIYEVDSSKLNKLIDIVKASVKENAWNELVGETIIVIFGDGEMKEVRRFEESEEVWEKMKTLGQEVRDYENIWAMFFDSVYKDLICYAGEGKIVNSEEWNGWKTSDLMEKVIDWLEKKDLCKKKVNYHLRDWLISRQRYWGPPIPMIYCAACDWQPVPEKDLPVELPFIKDYKPLSTGKAPLASHPEFYKTKCPKCGEEAKRETDVSDTFLDSAWYFLRYVSTDIDTTAFDRERVKKWLPVNMYIGGAEHSVLHLLYSRFVTMVLKDLGFISFEEPFTKFRAHGLIIKNGAKMSKSKGNVAVPDKYIRKFGADAMRAYLMFMSPFSQGGDFRDTGIEGMHRFLRRVWTLMQKSISNFQFPISNESQRMMHKTIKKVTEDISNLLYNTSIAALMEWYNFLSQRKSINKEEIEVFVKLLAPFAPHVSEELYQLLTDKKEFSSIHNSSWPKYDPKFLVKNEIIIVVQVNGKLRGDIAVDLATSKDKVMIEELGKHDSNVAKHLETKKIKKVIYVEGRVLNFVTSV